MCYGNLQLGPGPEAGQIPYVLLLLFMHEKNNLISLYIHSCIYIYLSINMCHPPSSMIIVRETVVVSLCLHINQLLTGSL